MRFRTRRPGFSPTTSTARARRSIPPAIAGGDPGRARDWNDIVLYELHVGAFTPEGTFAAAAAKLDHLAELGVTAIEIMPVSDFSGRWNWGYDGAFPYAPDASYGRPEDFKALVEAAHGKGIAVLLDVVYNHFGPEGNLSAALRARFLHQPASNALGRRDQFRRSRIRGPVRDFFIENAEYWIEEFHLDGLRLDAVHAIKDDSEARSPRRTRRARVDRAFAGPSTCCLRTRATIRAVWCAGAAGPSFTPRNGTTTSIMFCMSRPPAETSGYYADYGGTELLGRALAEGFAYQGEMMPYRDAPRGGPSARPAADAFVVLHPEPRPDRQPRLRRTAERARGARGHCARWPASICSRRRSRCCSWARNGARRSPFLFFCDFQANWPRRCAMGGARSSRAFRSSPTRSAAAKIPDPLRGSDVSCVQARLGRHRRGRISRYYRALLARAASTCRPLLPDIRQRRRGARFWATEAVRVVWQAPDARGSCSTPTSRRERSTSPIGQDSHSGAAARRKRVRPLERALERERDHERSPRDLPAAIARRLRLQRGGGDRALSRAARRQPCLSARRSSRRGRAARTATTSPITPSSIPNSGPRPTIAAMIEAFRARGPRAHSRFRAQPYGRRRRRQSALARRARMGAGSAMPAGSTSTGARCRDERQSCSRRCSARNMARSSEAASSSSSFERRELSPSGPMTSTSCRSAR